MKNPSYILSFGGWIGLVATLLIVIFFNKCGGETQNVVNQKTEVHYYYDSAIKLVPVKNTIRGEPIIVEVPALVDTQKILSAYFSINPYTRIFEDSSLIVVLADSISQNKFLSPAKFTYKWLKPIKTVTSTTVTTEQKKRIQLLAGAHADFNRNFFQDWGPDVYLQTKRGQLFGIGGNIKQETISIKAAINLNDAFRNKNK